MQFPAPALLIVTIKLISQRLFELSPVRFGVLVYVFYDTSNEAYTGRQRWRERERERQGNKTELSRAALPVDTDRRWLSQYLGCQRNKTKRSGATTTKHLRINQKMRKTSWVKKTKTTTTEGNNKSKKKSNRAALEATTGDTFRHRNALKGALSEI